MPGPYKSWPYPLDMCQTRQAYSGSDLIYEGYSPDPTAEDGDAKWVIIKHYWSDGKHTGSCFADSDDNPNKVWDDRESYTYYLDS